MGSAEGVAIVSELQVTLMFIVLLGLALNGLAVFVLVGLIEKRTRPDNG